MDDVQKTKKPYTPPQFEFYDYAVEHGFAGSTPIRIYDNEEVTQITDETGENYHGEWF